jgi:hypothetical protein
VAPRLVELRRVLKDTGTLYLHCDPTASHYLSFLLDVVFGAEQFLNEIIWSKSSKRMGLGDFAFSGQLRLVHRLVQVGLPESFGSCLGCYALPLGALAPARREATIALSRVLSLPW